LLATTLLLAAHVQFGELLYGKISMVRALSLCKMVTALEAGKLLWFQPK
jgi:hypothetical protein